MTATGYGSDGDLTRVAKAGDTMTGGLITPALEIPTGAAAGDVWTSDAHGSGSWQPSSGGGGSVISVFNRIGAVAAQNGDYSIGQISGAGSAASQPSSAFDTAGAASAAQAAAQTFATNAVAAETTRAQAAEATKIAIASEGAANGVATLDGSSHLTAAQSVFSRQILVAADGLPSVQVAPVGTWTPTYLMDSDTGGVWSGWINLSDGAQNDSISFDFACEAGTYTIELLHLAYVNRGIYTIQVDGVSVGAIDGYAAALTAARSRLAGVALTAGRHVITILMATQNVSASGYVGLVERLVLTQTA